MVAPKCWLPLYEFRTDLNNSKSLKISLIIATSLPLVVSSESRLVAFCSLRPYGLYSLRNSPGQNTGVDSHSLLQEIFPIQGLNSGLLHGRQILYQLSQRSTRILEWVAYPFSSRFSQPRNRTGVFCIAGRFLTN